jgi:cytochrome c oxidase assembly factor CtaG
MKNDLIFLTVALPFNFFVFWTTPLTALIVFATMFLLRYVSPVGE